MPSERYFSKENFSDSQSLVLEDLEFHHLCHVMRARIGDSIELVNGKGELATATVQTISKTSSTVKIIAVERRIVGCPRKVILALALSRFNRLEFVLEKSTELGASEFWLFPSMLSEKTSISPNQENRMLQITVAAMKQCGRLDLPQIKLLPPLSSWTKPPIKTLLFGDTRPDSPYFWQLPSFDEKPVLFFIGPEKGFHPQEIETLERQFGARGVRLHPYTLRVDTAPIVALSLLQAHK